MDRNITSRIITGSLKINTLSTLIGATGATGPIGATGASGPPGNDLEIKGSFNEFIQ